MTNKAVDKSNKCLFLIAEKNKWAIKDLIKPLNGVFNGAGWFIEEKHRLVVEQISQQVNMRYLDFPLNGETFEELRRRNKREFINEKTIKTKFLIDSLKATLEIHVLDNQELIQGELCASLENSLEGKQLLELLKEYDYLHEQIKYTEDEEKISKLKFNVPPIISIGDRIKSHNATLEKYRGRRFLGLCVKPLANSTIRC